MNDKDKYYFLKIIQTLQDLSHASGEDNIDIERLFNAIEVKREEWVREAIEHHINLIGLRVSKIYDRGNLNEQNNGYLMGITTIKNDLIAYLKSPTKDDER